MQTNKNRMVLVLASAIVAVLLAPGAVFAAGTLTPAGSSQQPLEIADHHVEVVINNGFARTEVTQTFRNTNENDIEGIYAFPLPKSASLAEMTIVTGEQRLQGEVVPRKEATKIYEEERGQGNDSGLASKEGYERFEFRVSRVPKKGQVTIRFAYYQALAIDTGVGRYHYPLQEGGTEDVAAAAFWLRRDKVEGQISVHVTLKSAWPVEEVRVPGFEATAAIKQHGAGSYEVELDRAGAALDKDFVLYYRLADDLPGRVELVPYRPDPKKPGTFMMVLTPGIDLQPLARGADYVFVLDVSGSMEGKLATLAQSVVTALGELDPADRFRIVTFDDQARSLTRGWIAATPKNVKRHANDVSQLRTGGSTNLYAGLKLGLDALDDDRATSLVLVTDAVTNTGEVDPGRFRALMEQYDVRVFGFLLGNSANWPLMRVVCDTSGGFYASVSNADDVLGQIMLAKSKVTHEALHDVDLRIKGVKVSDLTDVPQKVYRGQQLVIFGRYQKGGKAKLVLRTRQTGADKSYETEVELPDVDARNPELERLWALDRVEKLEFQRDTGELADKESAQGIRDLGVTYQIVTDETSMVVLSDEAFSKHGVERNNRDRIEIEQQAQDARVDQSPQSFRADEHRPLFGGGSSAPRLGGGGGALGVDDALLALLALGGLGLLRRRKRG
ncbi:MAG: VWA domain-containing protein [Deltaproteobacteria bacterium]|nr:VWA domain-containing protein [Deltaproteobacteria bacterium]